MEALLKRVIRLFRRNSFDDVYSSLLAEYGVDLGQLKSAQDVADATHAVIERATRDGTARGRDVAAELSYKLGLGYFVTGNLEQAAVALRQTVTLGKTSSAPRVLGLAAAAAFGLADKLPVAGEKGLELCYEAMELGERSATPLGLSAAAGGASGVAVSLKHHDMEGAKRAWRRAEELGRRSGTPEGLETAAMCAVSLGIALESERAKLEAEEWYQRAIDLGLKSRTGGGKTWARGAKALLDGLRHQGMLP